MVDLTKSEQNLFSYQDWVSWFAQNNERRLVIDFSQEKELPEETKALIFPSIRAFQKGEGSDGVYLLKAVEKFVQKTGELEYREAMQWFVKEENWHSVYLKKYMDFHQVQAKDRSFLDGVFRKLRRIGGLNCEVTVLVTAEMIALTYYDALSKSADSAALKSICAQMLHDEVPHVVFQSYTLSHFKNRWTARLVRKLVMDITLLFVWCACHRLYRAGGYRFGRFWAENRGYLRQSILLADRFLH